MPRLWREVSLAFLDRVIAEPSPEEYKGSLVVGELHGACSHPRRARG